MYLFGRAVLQMWSERPALQAMLKKGVRSALLRKGSVRKNKVSAVLDDLMNTYLLDLTIDKAAVQVMMLEYAEVTPDRTIHPI